MPKTLGEKAAGETYIPTDAIPLEIVQGQHCPDENKPAAFTMQQPQDPSWFPAAVPLPQAFPDQTVRQSVHSLKIDAKVAYSAVAVTQKNESYRLIVDYANTTNITKRIWVTEKPKANEGDPSEWHIMALSDAEKIAGCKCKDQQSGLRITQEQLQEGRLPVTLYIGIGLRLEATFFSNKSRLNVNGIGSLAVDSVSGTLLAQTLGITGSKITALLPFQTELNKATIENSVVALRVVKSRIWDESTFLQPRVVGFKLPGRFRGDREAVKQVVDALSLHPVKWERPCFPKGHPNQGNGPQTE